MHFGTYEIGYGPIDPVDYITQPKGKLSPLTVDLEALGHWMRVQESSLHVNISYDSRSERVASLGLHSPIKVLAAAGDRYRVLLPDNRSGYIFADSVESLNETLEHQVISFSHAIKEAPREDAATVESICAGEEFSVLAKFEEFWFVKTQQGNRGWLQIPTALSTEM